MLKFISIQYGSDDAFEEIRFRLLKHGSSHEHAEDFVGRILVASIEKIGEGLGRMGLRSKQLDVDKRLAIVDHLTPVHAIVSHS